MTGLMDEAHLNYYRQFGHTVAVWSAKLVIEDLLGHIDALTEKLAALTAERDQMAEHIAVLNLEVARAEGRKRTRR